MKKIHPIFFFSLLLFGEINGQARLVINNGGYVVLSGGTSSTSIYLVVDNANVTSGVADGIKRITSGHIISEGEYNKVQWKTGTAIGLFEFPLGRSSTYLPFYFNKTTAGTESSTGRVTTGSWFTSGNATGPSAVPPADLFCVSSSAANVLDRYWQIDVTGYSANPSADIRFYYDQTNDLGGIAEADLQAQRWDATKAGTCKWVTPPVGTVDATNNYVSVTGVSSFSPWTLVNRNSPLPIELISFSGSCEKGIPLLTWETAAETNNSFFTIEQSANGQTFETIGTVQGAGNSSTLQQYQFLANSNSYPDKDLTFRLKQTDNDGNFSYSGIAMVKACNGVQNDNVSIIIGSYDEVIISVNATASKKYNLYFYDNLGRKIHSEVLNVTRGENIKTLNPKKFATGIYLISLQNEEEVITQKLFLK